MEQSSKSFKVGDKVRKVSRGGWKDVREVVEIVEKSYVSGNGQTITFAGIKVAGRGMLHDVTELVIAE